MNTITRGLACGFAACALAMGGCVGAVVAIGAVAAAATGGILYHEGKLVSSEPASLEALWTATQAAVTDLQLTAGEETKDALNAHLLTKKADGTEVHIYLDRSADTMTQVTIRVGVFGDEIASRAILDKIRERAGLPRTDNTVETTPQAGATDTETK